MLVSYACVVTRLGFGLGLGSGFGFGFGLDWGSCIYFKLDDLDDHLTLVLPEILN